MKLRIYSPDIHLHAKNHTHISPPLYFVFYKDLSQQQLIEKFGEWLNRIELVNSIEDCDIVIPATQINRYYEQGKLKDLVAINELAVAHGKLMVCWTGNDYGITPKELQHFHLYRNGGYRSRNKGNEFLSSFYNKDPLVQYYNGANSYTTKQDKPYVGFCGQGKTTLSKHLRILGIRIYHKLLYSLGKRLYDAEEIIDAVKVRERLLNFLEQSPLIEANFIRYNKYRGGVVTPEEAVKSERAFYENIRQSMYTVCYRGNGNFSIRFYETLCMGRIPVIVLSDNNLPFPDLIDWSIFPVVKEQEYSKIATIINDYHQRHTNEELMVLQKRARDIFTSHISYAGFMNTFTSRYLPSPA